MIPSVRRRPLGPRGRRRRDGCDQPGVLHRPIVLETECQFAMQQLVAWLSLFACLAVIGVASTRFSHYGDIVSGKAGASRGWVGLILLATATSLPEMLTGLSAVTTARAPDIAAGDLLGSCVFNLLAVYLVNAFLLYVHGH